MKKQYLMIGALYVCWACAEANWTEIDSGVMAQFKRIEFKGAYGWISDSEGRVLLTQDSGEHWVLKTGFPGNSVDFINADQGWATRSGQVSSTDDGGNSWITHTDERFSEEWGWHNNIIQFFNAEKGWLFSKGVPYLTENSGLTWQAKNDSMLDSISFITDIHLGQDSIWFSIWGGGVVHSHNNGTTWTIQNPEEVYYHTGLDFMSRDSGWLAGLLMKGRGFGLLGNIVVGIVGAVVGGYVFSLLGIAVGGLLGSVVTATVGATLLLFVIGLIKRV